MLPCPRPYPSGKLTPTCGATPKCQLSSIAETTLTSVRRSMKYVPALSPRYTDPPRGFIRCSWSPAMMEDVEIAELRALHRRRVAELHRRVGLLVEDDPAEREAGGEVVPDELAGLDHDAEPAEIADVVLRRADGRGRGVGEPHDALARERPGRQERESHAEESAHRCLDPLGVGPHQLACRYGDRSKTRLIPTSIRLCVVVDTPLRTPVTAPIHSALMVLSAGAEGSTM